VADLFRKDLTTAEVLSGSDRSRYPLSHERSGEVVLISRPDAWFAYYWWLEDAKAPPYARTVDIHRKPGYDPVELFIEMPARAIPLNAALVKGSHGHPEASRGGVLVASDARACDTGSLSDFDVARIVIRNFGLTEDCFDG
jgi:hypothetical protein